ncbi:LamG domain-containing protein [Fulvitalea axinellae]|uniref:LamG domain-containing protein n=1 Tax=Fulvitalea axinellae TaxID=1182444 RepID=UPI0030CA4243
MSIVFLVLVGAVSGFGQTRPTEVYDPVLGEKCFEFDGDKDLIITDTVLVSGDFSLNVWFNPSDLNGSDRTLLSFKDQFFVNTRRVGRFLELSNMGRSHRLCESVILVEGQWQMLTLVYISRMKTFRIYVDGERVASEKYEFLFKGGWKNERDGWKTLVAGSCFWAGNFKGRMQLPEYRRRAYLDEEVKELYRAKTLNIDLASDLQFFMHLESDKDFLDRTEHEGVEVIEDEGRLALSFDGDSSFVQAGKVPVKNAMTISAWVKFSGLKFDNAGLVDLESCVGFRGHRGNSMKFTVAQLGDLWSEEMPLEEDRWTHLSVAFSERDSVRFFLNGEFISQHKVDKFWFQPEHNLVLGTDFWRYYFRGKMRDVGYWTRKLSDSEIKRIYFETDSVATQLAKAVGQGKMNSAKEEKSGNGYWWLLLLVPVTGWIIYSKKRKREVVAHSKLKPIVASEEIQSYTLPERNALFLFGKFALLDDKGEDVSGKFTPKLREIFLLILIRTIRGEYITSKELNEAFWEGYGADRAKNNRSVSIKKIRSVLDDVEGVELINDQKKFWKLVFDDGFFVDFASLYDSFSKKEIPDEIGLAVLDRGIFLEAENHECFDRIKAWLDDSVLGLFDIFASRQTELPEAFLRLVLRRDPANVKAYEVLLNRMEDSGRRVEASRLKKAFHADYERIFGTEYAEG